MITSYKDNRNEVFMEKSESISSWRVSETHDSQEISPSNRICSSERDNESTGDHEEEQHISQRFRDIIEVKKINQLKLIENHE
jgi:hypothetical protein